ncbi:MAG: response regulator [Deltaproteobacteria bacterium]|nr:response regulator [Nannocystaceae bacterium]
MAGGRKAPTAALLGVSRKCLWEKIRAHEIIPAEYREDKSPAPGAKPVEDFGVLLVEDNPADARIVCELLGESSEPRYDVRQVSRLGDVGSKLDDRRPDVILLDLHLPDSSGLATLEHVRALDGEIPIVVLTGAWEPGLERGALRGGADVMVSKDHVDAGLLARVLDYAVAQRKRLYGAAARVQSS